MGESARFVTALALLPESDVGLLVSYNTPPADGTSILFRFLDVFYPIERVPPQPATVPGWAARADAVPGTYISSRVAHTSPQKLITWLGTLPVRATGEGELAVGARRSSWGRSRTSSCAGTSTPCLHRCFSGISSASEDLNRSGFCGHPSG